MGHVKPYYAYRFTTEHRRFSVFKWLGITMVIFIGGSVVELGVFVFLHDPATESALAMAEDFPRDVRVSRDRGGASDPVPDVLEFTVGRHRIHYRSNEPKFEAVVTAVTRAEHRLEFTTGLFIAGGIIFALGLTMAVRFFRGNRQDAASAARLVTTELSDRELFLFDPADQRFLPPDSVRITRDSPLLPLASALIAVGFFVWTALSWRDAELGVGWHLSVLGTLALVSLGSLRIWRHRYGLLPHGKIVMAATESRSRVRSVDDDGVDLDVVDLAYMFHAPSGRSIRGTLCGPIRREEFARWPEPGALVAMVILYFGPEDYWIL